MISQANQYRINKLGIKFGNPALLTQVLEQVNSGDAICLEGPEMGVVIFKPIFRNGLPGSLVWVAIANCREAMASYLPMLEDMTREVGGKFVEFQTKRKGFKRYAKQFNFKEGRPCDGFLVFTKEV